MESNTKILICDENGDFRRITREYLKSAGFRTPDEAASVSDALAKIGAFHHDIVITDVYLGGIDASVMIERASKTEVSPEYAPSFIVTSQHNNIAALTAAATAGADYCVLKPLNYPMLVERIKRLMIRRSMIKRGAEAIALTATAETAAMAETAVSVVAPPAEQAVTESSHCS